jgi:trimethylamine--corrinoid protein Co-methyltransferase
MRFQKGKLLSDGDIQAIHNAGLEILETLGVKIQHPEVYRKVVEAGAIPSKDETAVTLPRDLVMRCVKQCPRTVTLADRRGGAAALEPGGRPYYFTGNALTWTDGGNAVRPITSRAYADWARVVDSLDQVFGMVGTYICDVPAKSRDVTGFKLMAEHTRGHLRPCLFSAEGAKVIMEMADVVLGGAAYESLPFFSLGYSIVSPLHWSTEACEIFLQTAGRKIPLTINSEPLAGGTSPVTLAGSLATGNAEVLSGIVLNQVLEPGRPLVYNIGFAHLLDMYTAVALTGSPENRLMAGGRG